VSGEHGFVAMDSASLSAFAATLTNLPKEEIQKAKRLYVLNAMADFEAQRKSSRTMIIVMGVMCIIPIFLIVFIPALIAYRAAITAMRQKILNAIDVWKDDLGSDYQQMRARVMAGSRDVQLGRTSG
jgi:hypothetical protein